MKVAVAEDGALFREGLLLLLRTAGHEVVGTVADGDALMDLLAGQLVEVAILDIRMPPGADGGLSTAARIRAKYPETGLLLLSHYAQTHYLTRVLEIDTERIGYRLKERIAGVSVLTDTLDRIGAGEIVIEPALARRLVGRRGDRDGGPLATLTERESEALRFMAEGRSNNGIAAAMSLTAKAVERHIAGIFMKLDLPADATAHNRRVLAVLTYLRAHRNES